MRDEYDFSTATRGAVVRESGKTRITIRIDSDLLDWFRERAGDGGSYQSLINDALRAHVRGCEEESEGLLERTLRRVIREELKSAG